MRWDEKRLVEGNVVKMVGCRRVLSGLAMRSARARSRAPISLSSDMLSLDIDIRTKQHI